MTDSNHTSSAHSDTAARRVRVTLRYIEILDSKDVDTRGEFRFRFRAGVPERDDILESRIPEDEHNHISVSEHPSTNRISLDSVLFEGDVAPGESLLVEATGEEIDRFTRNDPITRYRRLFAAPLDAALGEHGPWDEVSGADGDGDGASGAAATTDAPKGNGDPEHLSDWRFAYVIEPA